MEYQEPSVDHREVLAVVSSERVVTEEVEMSDTVSVPAGSTTVSADQAPVTGDLQLAIAGASMDDGMTDAAIATIGDEEYQLEQLENVQVAIKVYVIH